MRASDLWHRITRVANWFGDREPVALVAVLLIIGGAWLFIKIADEVVEGETLAFDKWVIREMRRADDPSQPIGPPWVQEMGRDMTALGGVSWLVFFTAVVVGYLWLDRKDRMAIFVIAAVASGWLIVFGLKHFFARPRPDIVPHLSHVYTSSFPSGHSMLSAVVYLTLGSLVATVVPRRRLKLYVLGVGLVLSGFVGVSRVYLGVHYPTDVLAGWTAGVVWSLVCWLVARSLQRRGKVEGDLCANEEVRNDP